MVFAITELHKLLQADLNHLYSFVYHWLWLLLPQRQEGTLPQGPCATSNDQNVPFIQPFAKKKSADPCKHV